MAAKVRYGLLHGNNDMLTFAPVFVKVGCSNWKRVFLILAGIVDLKQKQRPSIDVFRQVNSLANYSPKEQEHRLM